MKTSTCCFSGHRILPKYMEDQIKNRLSQAVNQLIEQGINTFISGGALGFDQLAASVIIEKKQENKSIRLLFALPCVGQDARWNASQRSRYRALLLKADEVIYVSQQYKSGCMQKRNRFMVDHSSHLICALLYPGSGTGQTVAYAKQKNLYIINIFES